VLLISGALVATTSRGGILSFAAALVLASVATRRHQHGLPVAVLAVILLTLPLAWFGLERLEMRFGGLHAEAGRMVVWRHSVASMSGTWLTGAGLNTFAAAISRAVPYATPAGATAWPGEVAEAIPAGVRVGHRTPTDLADWQWYHEAHNDYLQLAVEMGVVGVALGVWALILLARRMREPWLAAGVAGILVHSTVDFPLQIPAVAVLFLAMCSHAERTRSGPGTE
jgi:O-antigen ligase